MAKRKKDEEYRTFQDEWTEEFAFVERAGSAVCLICNDKIASMKRSNVKRHFDTRHATFASKYPAGDSRKKACQELLSRVQASQQQLCIWTRQGDCNSASFAGSLAIVRNGKPFTDGEYAKTFMLDVANELFDDLPNKDKIIKRIQNMPLSARTVHDRTIMMANQAEETQVKDINAAPFFSLALDESTDLAGFTSSLLQSFKARFGEFREHTRLFKFITHPNECSLNTADLSYIPGVSVRDFEAEVADLKASDMWVNKFKSLNEDLERIARQKAELASKHMWTEMKKLQPEDQLIIKTWNTLPVTYHTLQRVSIAVLTMFGSTYACEQSFSHLKNIKSNLRSRLTDESLNACMKLNLTKYQPDYKAISKSMQHQKSH
ncbi:general transcription factor II-I repeat domain-containing protein 2-like protein [Lates japonicus]|uniref:General transcription factor II-I repeat domain-containing protein 2-like protein n=1 Tax=Lates japonicus TaxID=270547 RepID=A0AAD3NBE4_LATJO|nr:general transcription factor II-I repeat domain-containing protein 2-like protein [Lates japonicus]GLD68390.1 general transcription factor II-I repeat domain-containing protein 2-like protein [Lates japonicus]